MAWRGRHLPHTARDRTLKLSLRASRPAGGRWRSFEI